MVSIYRILALILPGALLLGACLREGRERALIDLDIGAAAAGDVSFTAIDGLAHVRAASEGQLDLWASAPAFELAVTTSAQAVTEWRITVQNCMPDAEMVASLREDSMDPGGVVVEEVPGDGMGGPLVKTWRVTLPAPIEARLRVAPPDASTTEPWRFAVMGDIQEAMDNVDEVFRRIGEQPGVRFIASTGDLIDRAVTEQYELLEEKYTTLTVPYYTTIGNHELYGDYDQWSSRFGRANVHFRFKGVAFSLVDSASASIDPTVYEWLDGWLADASADVHVFGTHYPPVDPVGVRQGSFRSRNEAAKLLTKLASAEVDLTLYGHIHSYYEFENAGIPAFISGGGGALPERLDNIGRHFLVVDVADERIANVTVVRVDD